MGTDSRGGSPSRRWATAIAIAVTVVGTTALLSFLIRGRSVEVLYHRWVLHVLPFALVLVWLGRALVRRRNDRWLARLFLGYGLLVTIHVVAAAISDASLVAAGIDTSLGQPFAPAEIPLFGAISFWIGSWLWLTWSSLGFPVLLLCFPDGRLPGPRWRWVFPVLGLGLVALVAGHGIATWPTSTVPIHPDAIPTATSLTTGLTLAGALLVLGGTIASFASIVGRWRRAQAEQRQQIRVVGISLGLLALTVSALWPWPWLWAAGQLVAGTVLLVAYTFAILRYRLHDLEIAINRTLVGSLLAIAVTGVYLAVVVGIGNLVGRTADNALLPLIAVGLIAVLFEPTRRRLRRVVDRRLYGRDLDAYEVLSDLATQVTDAGGSDRVAGRVAELLVRGTGATRAEITITGDGRPRLLAAADRATREQTDGPEAPTAGQVVLREPIRHEGVDLGEAVLVARGPSDLAPDASRLLEHVVGMLGTVLRNVQLTEALQAQVDELRRSRARLVAAQDDARRALERDLHDGAQARLVALRLQLGIAEARARSRGQTDDGDASAELFEGLGADLDEAIRTLRGLSRGLRPPLLESDGLAAAIRSEARGLPVDVELVAPSLDRLDARIEAAVYFCCLEAIRNAAAYAPGSAVRVALELGDDHLRFSIADDGVGFDPTSTPAGTGLSNLHDRVAALGGDVEVVTAPGHGVRVTGAVPLQPTDGVSGPMTSAASLREVEEDRSDPSVDIRVVDG